MGKRFIDTDRHRKALRGLDCKTRLAHEWLWQNCDHAGIWAMDPEMFRFECGYPLDVQALLKACPWVQMMPNGALFISDFIEVNYGKLKDGYNPHKPVFRSLQANGIEPETLFFQPLPNPCPRVEEEEEGEGEGEGEGEVIPQGRKERAHEPEIIPAGMSVELHAAFKRWEKYKIEKRSKMTPSTRDAFRKKWTAVGDDRAIAAIDHSISQGWTGCFEPKDTQQPQKNQTIHDYAQRVAADVAQRVARYEANNPA